MIREIDIFVTDKCNADCDYCFVAKGTYCMSRDDVDRLISHMRMQLASRTILHDAQINILGGEPSLAGDEVFYLIFSLQELGFYRIRLYSNGSNVQFLHMMKALNIDIIINYDAFVSLDGKLDDIRNYKWNMTIAPSTLDKIIGAADNFVAYHKELDFSIARYRTKNSHFWTGKDMAKLDIAIDEMYKWYESKLLVKKENYMPFFMKRALIQLMAASYGYELSRDCSHKLTYIGYHIRMCYAEEHMQPMMNKCSVCNYGTVCDFRKSCYSRYDDDILCHVQDILMEKTIDLNHRLKDNDKWQRVIMSIYEGNVNGKNR